MGGLVAFVLLVLYFSVRGIGRVGATSYSRMMRTAARYAASSGRRR